MKKVSVEVANRKERIRLCARGAFMLVSKWVSLSERTWISRCDTPYSSTGDVEAHAGMTRLIRLPYRERSCFVSKNKCNNVFL